MGLKDVAKTRLTLRKNHKTTLNFMDFTKLLFFFSDLLFVKIFQRLLFSFSLA